MKRMVAIILSLVLLLTAMACGGSNAGADNVGGVDAPGKETAGDADQGGSAVEVSEEILEALGMSAEEWAAMDPAKQEALMAEMGLVLEQDKKEEQEEEQTKPASQKYTPDDVMAGGSYRVVMGDYLNSITLYYENGKLVKIVEEFQKNSEELAEIYTYEGEDVAKYTFNFIDWANAPLQDILDGMKDYGAFGHYEIGKIE